jgi:AcrR family transcriptional regulator
MKSDRTKENIIDKTIILIKETNGDIDGISIRKIAERAGIGTGLVNHYFQSKENLIEICVQTNISDVIYAFAPESCESQDPAEITKCVARQVMDFLMTNSQISRVSILGDCKQPKVMDNTMKTVMGFAHCLSGGQITDAHKASGFLITSVLQTAFLRKDILKDCLQVDFYDKAQRDSFINQLIERAV